MSDAKHTPGPWERDGKRHGTLTEYVEAKGRRVAAIYEVDISNDVEVEANAHLIAAAPDLLEALKVARADLVSFGRQCGLGPPDAGLSYIDKAIAKAEGREP